MTDPLDPVRKRLLWRACHRGIKEMDLILGGYARARIAAMTEEELRQLEAAVALPDQELLAWALKAAAVPREHASPVLLELLAFRP
jgi:antitoxin CptB